MLYTSVILILTNVVATLFFSIILLAHTVPRRLRFTLAATIISLLLWQDTIYLADQLTNNLVLWNTVIFIWPTSAILSCFAFIRFIHIQQIKRRELSRFTIPLTIATILQIIPIVTLEIFSYVRITSNGLDIGRSVGYYVYLFALGVSLICLIAELLTRLAKSHKHTQEHQATNVVFVTVLVASIYGIIINVVIPLLTQNQDYIGFGVIIIDIFAIGLWLSIAREGLLDIRFYAVRAVVYVLSLGTLAFTYAVLAYLISQWVLDQATSPTQNTINIALALILAFIFQPLRRFFDHLTSRIFYRDSYDNDTFYTELSRTLTTTTDLRALLERAAQIISKTLKSEQAFFFIKYGDSQYMSAGTLRHAKLPVQDAETLTQYSLTNGSGVILANLLEDDVMIKRLLLSHRIEMVLPLKKSDGLLGYLFLGDQKSNGYTRRDIRIFESISNELVIAIRNALSVQALRELNASLEQRIDEGTRELRKSNAQLRRLDEAKDEFISMASHQLRTPLTSVKGYISMVMEGDVGKVSDTQKRLLGEAFTSSERMVHLINDFLNVSRLQTGKFVIDKHPVNLSKLVEEEIHSLETNAKARQLKFSYKPLKKFPMLDLDEGKIRQVVMNFADNAIYYSKEGSTIKVEMTYDAKDVIYKVIDTGIGVPVAEQAHLFGKFFRATNARKQRPDGTGVGLFLAKKVVTAHGGEVIFESVENQGSTFGFRLPIDKLRTTSDADNLDN